MTDNQWGTSGWVGYNHHNSNYLKLQDNNSSMLFFFLWSKMVFVGHSFSELQKCFKLSLLLMRSLTILGTVSMWSDSLCLASQWKCWRSDIHFSVLNTKQYYYNVRLFWKEAKTKLGRTQKCDCDTFNFLPFSSHFSCQWSLPKPLLTLLLLPPGQ